MQDQSQQTASVVVVGGGPVGLASALALARGGVRSIILEADEDVCDGSRAICISRRSLQILDRLGVSAPFLELGLPWSEGETFLGTTPVFEFSLPSSAADRFPPFINLQQHHAEAFLVDACARTGMVELRRGATATSITAGDEGVSVRYERAGRTESVDSDWLVAADGARSIVRDQMAGARLQGRSYETKYLIADIELDCPWPTRRLVWFDPASNPGATVIMHRQPESVWRIDFQLPPIARDEEVLALEAVQSRIDAHLRMLGISEPWRLIWRSLYRAHTLSLDHYVHGRTLFAGDAAHLVPIFGVRGLNSGLEDAFNLAWRLALVAQEQAPPGILESYSRERRSACLDNFEQATKTTWFMSPPSDGYRLMRDAVLELAVDTPGLRSLIDPRQSSPYRYGADPSARAEVGLPLREAVLSDGRHLHDLLGPGFTLIRSVPGLAQVEWSCPSSFPIPGLRALDLPAQDLAAAVIGLRPGEAFLVRPDDYVECMFDAGSDAAQKAEAAWSRLILHGGSLNAPAA